MTHVKICGLTQTEDIVLCVAAGANALGFVVEYPQPTPWTLTRLQAVDLMRHIPASVQRVVVVGGDAATILELCYATQPDAVQLHADEPEAVVTAVAAGLAHTGTRLIKALRVRAGAIVDPGETTAIAEEWAAAAQRFLDAGAHAILLDAKVAGRPGGTGQTFDWQIARQVVAMVSPVILAGGLTPENVGAAITAVRPAGVDVLSALEDPQHRKIPARVQAFMRATRIAAHVVGGDESRS